MGMEAIATTARRGSVGAPGSSSEAISTTQARQAVSENQNKIEKQSGTGEFSHGSSGIVEESAAGCDSNASGDGGSDHGDPMCGIGLASNSKSGVETVESLNEYLVDQIMRSPNRARLTLLVTASDKGAVSL